ncbi:MAG: glycosyltransferase, partial [Calditrichia bacterium]
MICILHGYLLEGSGSNLWTRSIIQSLCRNGETVHLICLENHPERYDFISRMYQYKKGRNTGLVYQHRSPYKGECILHKPDIGETLPVYVWDQYEEFSDVVPMVQLPDAKIEEYISRNVEVVMNVVKTYPIEVLHANHAVLMSVVARRVSQKTSTPFAIMPHGSAIEYAVKKDERFLRLATEAFKNAGKIFVIGPEIRQRVGEVFASLPNLDSKMLDLNLGVDTSLFEPVSPRQRIEKISEMNKLLENLPRGKTEQQTGQLWNALSDSISLKDMKRAIRISADYISKNPDENVEQKLSSVRWDKNKLLLFVGRLIASKGIQLIIAALPLILEKQPGSKLIVVGHGPLREAMEALLWALRNGKEHLVENIIRWGKGLEGSHPGPFKGVLSFYSFLHERGEWTGYLAKAQQYLRKDSVIFTGYLT